MYQDSLFSSNSPQVFNFCGGQLVLYTGFIPLNDAHKMLHTLHTELAWTQSEIHIAGQKRLIPRLNCWMGDQNSDYSYSGTPMIRHEWNQTCLTIKELIQEVTPHHFNSVLANLYRDGQDSVSWHSDDEKELGQNPFIGVVSLGQSRRFDLRSKQDHNNKFSIELNNGSLLLMSGKLQHTTEHCIKKTAQFCAPRISLTFRTII
jgi:alkylated DNA repair dioxygenase AlkB